MKKLKIISTTIGMGLGLALSSSVFAQSLAQQYGVKTTADTISGTTPNGSTFECKPGLRFEKRVTTCLYSDGAVVMMGDGFSSYNDKDGIIRNFGTPESVDKAIASLGYTMIPNTTGSSNSGGNSTVVVEYGTGNIVKPNSGSGSSAGQVVAGIGAGVAAGAVIGGYTSPVPTPGYNSPSGVYDSGNGTAQQIAQGQEVNSSAQQAADKLTQTSAVGIDNSIKELDQMAENAGNASNLPKHDLRFGPTPTGDVFTFCMGPRPPKKSYWRYWYDYLCAHGQMSM